MKLKFTVVLALFSFFAFGQNLNYSWHSQLNGRHAQYLQGMTLLPDSGIASWGTFDDVVDFNPEERDCMLSSSQGSSFILKYTADGKFGWAVNFDTLAHMFIYRLKSDYNGDLYLYGTFDYSVDFDPSPNSFTLYDSLGHTFFAKYSGNDGHFIFVKQLNTLFNSQLNEDLAIDQNKNIFISGDMNDTIDFDPGPGINNVVPLNGGNCFVAKFDSAGNFSNVVQYDSHIFSKALTIDAANNLYVAGFASGTADVDFSNGTHTINDKSLYIGKYDNNFNFKKVAEFITSGATNTQSFQLSIDSHNEIFFTGMFNYGTIDFDASPNTVNLQTQLGGLNYFFTRQDTAFNYLSSFLIPTFDPSNHAGFSCMSTAIDSYNNLYAMGTVKYNYDADPGSGTMPYNTLVSTALMIKYTSSGTYLSSYLIDGDADYGWDQLLVGKNNRVYMGLNYKDTIDLIDGPDSLYLPYRWDGGPSWDATIAAYIQCSPSVNSLNLTICSGDSVVIGAESFKTPGIFRRRLTSVSDCDSIVILNLQVNDVDINTCSSGNNLISIEDNATYRWIDCNTQQIVSTSQSFNVPDNDGYEVEVTKGGCKDTSECFQIFSRANGKVPFFSWASKLPKTIYTGSHFEIDAKGNLIVAMTIGDTANIDLTGNNNYYLNGYDDFHMALAKYDQNRNVLWSFSLGRTSGSYGGQGESISQMCLDDDGNIYVSGANSEDFDMDPGPGVYIFPLTQTPCGSSFIAKYNSSGQFVWAKSFNQCHQVKCLFTNHAGSLFIGGIRTQVGTCDQWYIKELDCTNGNDLWYYSPVSSAYLEQNYIFSGVCDKQNNIIVTGCITGTMDFDPGPATHNMSSGAANNKQFIATYDVNHQLISVDDVNNQTLYPTYGCKVALTCDEELFLTNNGPYNSSIFKGNSNYFTYITNAQINDIETFNSDLYVAFNFKDSCFIGNDTLYRTGDRQIGVAKFTTDGDYEWAFTLGSNYDDFAQQIKIRQDESIYLHGSSPGLIDVDPGPSTYNLSGDALYSEFISVYNQNCGKVDTALTSDSLRLSVINDRAYYQWIDCTTGSPLPGANQATIPDYASGYYKVIIYEGNCVDTSSCHFASPTVGIQDPSSQGLNIYPNPLSSGLVNFSSEENMQSIQLFTLDGTALNFINAENRKSILVQLPKLESGVYLVKMTGLKTDVFRKIVVLN